MKTDPVSVTVRITESVMWDLQSREVNGEYGIPDAVFDAGSFTMTVDQARNLADDARYQADPVDAGCGQPFGLRMAYTALAKRIDQVMRDQEVQ